MGDVEGFVFLGLAIVTLILLCLAPFYGLDILLPRGLIARSAIALIGGFIILSVYAFAKDSQVKNK